MPITITRKPGLLLPQPASPLRLRVIYFLARTRLAQRLIMCTWPPRLQPTLQESSCHLHLSWGLLPGPRGLWKPGLGSPSLLPRPGVSGGSLSLEKRQGGHQGESLPRVTRTGALGWNQVVPSSQGSLCRQQEMLAGQRGAGARLAEVREGNGAEAPED